MSTKWIREFNFACDSTLKGIPSAIKMIAMFLRYGGTGFTYQSDDASNTGTGDSISMSGSTATLTDSLGVFSSSVVGSSVTISGATNPGNNGTFTITAWISRTQIQYTNASGVNETSSFTWTISGGDWFDFETNGTNGEFNLTGTDYQFRDSTASAFVVGDVGRYIVIAGNNRNAGIYEITSYVSATTIGVDFVCNADEFPDQETGLSWRVFDFDAVPLGYLNYVKFSSPGSPSWALKLISGVYFDGGQYVSMEVNPAAADASRTLPAAISGAPVTSDNYLYCAVDDGGDHFHLMIHQNTNNRHNGFFVARTDPPETRPDIEKVIVGGNPSTARSNYDNGNWLRNYDSTHIGYLRYWHNRLDVARYGYLVEPTYNAASDGFSMWSSRERNNRASGSIAGGGTGDSIAMSGSTATLTDAAGLFTTRDVGKKIQIWNCSNPGNRGVFTITVYLSATQIQYENVNGVNETSSFLWNISYQDLLTGTVAIDQDVNNDVAEYAFLGVIKGHYSSRSTLSARYAFPHVGYKDKFHYQSGWVLEWPNVTPQH